MAEAVIAEASKRADISRQEDNIVKTIGSVCLASPAARLAVFFAARRGRASSAE